MDDKIMVGRRKECNSLQMVMESNEAEFVVVYGRRRVGKTFLINTYYNDSYAFKLTGLAKKSKQEQLANFHSSLIRYSKGRKYTKPRTWYEAFDMLRDLLETTSTEKKRVIFIDELPWMDTRGSNLVSALEHFWNDWASTQNDMVFIVCGSATSWITKKIVKNHGGLHNRANKKIYLHHFTLSETKEKLVNSDIQMEDKEIAECYMIMGGIPYYLKNIRRGYSLAQNVDEMFFSDHGSLDGEFDALYASLFEKSDQYIKVVEALSGKKKGLTREELLAVTKMSNNGHFSVILQDLIDCDFIRSYRGYGNTSKNRLYQLLDPFTLFYFKFIRKFGTMEKSFWQYQVGTRLHDTWAGLAFEQLCLMHHANIEKALGISGIMTQTFSWLSSGDAKERAQIDLVIKRSDRVINVCEMKFYEDEYEMRKRDYEDMDRRIRLFRQSISERATIHPVLVTTYGLKRNEYSGMFQNVVTLSDLF